MRRWIVLFAATVVAAAAFGATPAAADHDWNGYHWARQSNPFTLQLGDNVNSNWDGHLRTASDQWSDSGVLDTVVGTGLTSPKTCKPRSGRVEVCNATYGRNGWLGIAQIWLSGGHISQGVVKLNDTYFNSAKYNTPAWRAFVTCQEIGHTFGLGHVNEVFTDPNTGSCMDYTNDPTGSAAANAPLKNIAPDGHDLELLASKYAHLDSTTTVSASTASAQGAGNSQADWGRAVSKGGPHGHADLYEKDLGDGTKVITHVFWADHEHEHEH